MRESERDRDIERETSGKGTPKKKRDNWIEKQLKTSLLLVNPHLLERGTTNCANVS